MYKPQRPSIERRSHPRLGLHLACHVHSPTLKQWRACGHTVNISRSGVLFKLDQAFAGQGMPPLGSRLLVDVELPTERILRCSGRLVRVTHCPREGTRLAVAIERMEFREHARKPVGVVQKARWSEVRELLM